MADLKQKMQGLGEALREFRGKIAELEDKVNAKMDEREKLRLAPPTRDEAMERIEHPLEAILRQGEKDVDRVVNSLGRLNSGRDSAGEREGYLRRVVKDGPGPNTDGLLYLLREPLRKALRETLDNDPRFDNEYSLPAAEREKRIEKLDSEIEKLEAEREGLIRQLREAGFTVREVEEVTS